MFNEALLYKLWHDIHTKAVRRRTIEVWPNRPSPLYFWSAPNTSEHTYVVNICKTSPQTKFERPQTPSKPVNSFSAVKVTFQFFTRFGMEMTKSDPRIRFLINFWPKKKKVVPQYVLNCQSYPQKRKFFNFSFFFHSELSLIQWTNFYTWRSWVK